MPVSRWVDARGLACPLPVIEAKKALKELPEGETLRVLVDNETAVQNLTRLASGLGLAHASSRLEEGVWEVRMARGDQVAAAEAPGEPLSCGPGPAGPIVAVISSDVMGGGSDELGRALMKSFLFALTQLERGPDAVLLYNGGARLSTAGSPALEDLRALEEAGCRVRTCGTCLNYYGLTDQLAVGEVTNMYEIAETLAAAGRILRP